MYYILRILFLFSLVVYGRGKSDLFKMFVFLQIISFVAEYLIDFYLVKTYDLITYIYVIFSCVMLFLITTPWSKVRIVGIYVKDKNFILFFEKWLIPVLSIIFIMNLALAVIIMFTMPDVSDYKLKDGWKDLYETIPMFALLNRVSYITQYMGYFALPLSFFYFSLDNNKRGLLLLFLSSSSLMAGIAAYSRAQMLIYAMCMMASYFLFQNVFSERKKAKIKKYAYRAFIILSILFLYTTINRFGSDNMAHYGDRIPPTSKIQDPIMFSILDYAGQGFPNGINQLVNYSPSKNFMGQDAFYLPLLFLDYFGIIHFDAAAAEENRDKVFGFDGGGFHGYTCSLVYNFGFFLTLMFGLIYSSYVRIKVAKSNRVSMTNAFFLVYLLIEPTISIFYSQLGIYVFPAAFYLMLRFFYLIKCGAKRKRIRAVKQPQLSN